MTAVYNPAKANDLISWDVDPHNDDTGIPDTALLPEDKKVERIAAHGADSGGFFRDVGGDAVFGDWYARVKAAYRGRTAQEEESG